LALAALPDLEAAAIAADAADAAAAAAVASLPMATEGGAPPTARIHGCIDPSIFARFISFPVRDIGYSVI